MSATVTDLLAERHKRGRAVVHFPTPVEALRFAAQQVAEARALTGSALLLDAQETDQALRRVAAVLDACQRLYETHSHDEVTR